MFQLSFMISKAMTTFRTHGSDFKFMQFRTVERSSAQQIIIYFLQHDHKPQLVLCWEIIYFHFCGLLGWCGLIFILFIGRSARVRGWFGENLRLIWLESAVSSAKICGYFS